MFRPIFSRLSLFIFSLLLLVTGAMAQGTSGNISGTVTDATGAVIPNAAVTVLSPISGHTQAAQTDANGQYRFSNLPFNRYHVSVAVKGFRSAAQDAIIRSAAITTVDFRLAVGDSEQTVTAESGGHDSRSAH